MCLGQGRLPSRQCYPAATALGGQQRVAAARAAPALLLAGQPLPALARKQAGTRALACCLHNRPPGHVELRLPGSMAAGPQDRGGAADSASHVACCLAGWLAGAAASCNGAAEGAAHHPHRVAAALAVDGCPQPCLRSAIGAASDPVAAPHLNGRSWPGPLIAVSTPSCLGAHADRCRGGAAGSTEAKAGGPPRRTQPSLQRTAAATATAAAAAHREAVAAAGVLRTPPPRRRVAASSRAAPTTSSQSSPVLCCVTIVVRMAGGVAQPGLASAGRIGCTAYGRLRRRPARHAAAAMRLRSAPLCKRPSPAQPCLLPAG